MSVLPYRVRCVDCGFLQMVQHSHTAMRITGYKKPLTVAQRRMMREGKFPYARELACLHGILDISENVPYPPGQDAWGDTIYPETYDAELLVYATRQRKCPEFFKFHSGADADGHKDLRQKHADTWSARKWDALKMIGSGAVGGIVGPPAFKWAQEWLEYMRVILR